MGVKERLKAFADYKRMSYRDLSINMGASPGYINSISKSIQPDKVSRLTAQYPELNIDWLLTGEGSMLVGGDVTGSAVVNGNNNRGSQTVNNAPSDFVTALNTSHALTEQAQKITAKQQEQIDRLLSIIERMQQQQTDKE